MRRDFEVNSNRDERERQLSLDLQMVCASILQLVPITNTLPLPGGNVGVGVHTQVSTSA